MEIISSIQSYVATEQGCQDIGTVELNGWVLVRKEDLERLRMDPDLVRAAKHAMYVLANPLTCKSEAAYRLLSEALHGYEPQGYVISAVTPHRNTVKEMDKFREGEI